MKATERPWGNRPLQREDILKASDVAELLGLAKSTVDDLARRDKLPSFRLGRQRRFLRADIEDFILSQRC